LSAPKGNNIMNLQCPRCKILLIFSTQETETSQGKTVRYDIYRCGSCNYQEKRLSQVALVNEVKVIKLPTKYRIESKDKNGKVHMIAEPYEFTTMCHRLGILFRELPDTATVEVLQAGAPPISSK